jgi:hypothetical protein
VPGASGRLTYRREPTLLNKARRPEERTAARAGDRRAAAAGVAAVELASVEQVTGGVWSVPALRAELRDRAWLRLRPDGAVAPAVWPPWLVRTRERGRQVIAEASGLAKWKQVATPRMISANVAGNRHDLAMPCPLLAGRRWDACGQR